MRSLSRIVDSLCAIVMTVQSLKVSLIVLRMRFSVSTSILRTMVSICQTNALATGVDLLACHLVENRDLAVFQHGSCQTEQLSFAV
jgi:hypothetical protein